MYNHLAGELRINPNDPVIKHLWVMRGEDVFDMCTYWQDFVSSQQSWSDTQQDKYDGVT